MSLPRIFFDTNDGTEPGGYWLGFERSKADLAAHRLAVSDGARVVIYMPDELEIEAVLRFESSEQVWWADPVPGTLRYLDGTA